MDKPSATFHLLTINDNACQENLILEKKQYSIGRNSENTIMIRDVAISRYHCTIFPIEYKNSEDTDPLIFWIVDGDLLGNRSSNGLFVNGDRCYSHELKSGDRITFMGTETFLEYTIATSTTNLEKSSHAALISKQDTAENRDKLETTLISQDAILTDLLDDIFRALSQQNKVNQTNDSSNTASTYQYCYLETDLDGAIISYDEIFARYFPLLVESFASHPFTQFLREDIMANEARVAIRKIKYRRKFYTHYARLDPTSQIIKSYIFDFVVTNEVTTLRESEEKYRAIVRQVSQGIILVDPQNLRILEANQAYCNLIGYSATDILQLTLADLISGDRHILLNLIESVLNSRRDICRESIHRRQDGTWIDVEEDISFIANSTQKVICFAVRDITSRKQTERQLQQSLAEKEILLKEIHHRVKNNLLVVSSLLDWRSESITDPKLQAIFIESQRRIATIALIHEKLYGTKDLAQIDFGDYIETLAVQIFQSFSIYESNPNRIRLDCDLAPILLNIETAMPCGLIVNELLLNTFKHAFPEGRSGNVHLTFQPQSVNSYILIVEDDGVGFPMDFDPNTTDSLGWQLINLLTTQLDGTIQIKPSHGSRIELVFSHQNYYRRI